MPTPAPTPPTLTRIHTHSARCLEEMSVHDGPGAHLLDILFSTACPRRLNAPILTFVNPQLNKGQREAVTWALSQADIAVIHGPPGTGKTTVVVEVVAQLARQGKRIVACAPSNIAVDNMVERLVRWGVTCIRLGHPARMLDSVVQVGKEGYRIIKYVFKERNEKSGKARDEIIQLIPWMIGG